MRRQHFLSALIVASVGACLLPSANAFQQNNANPNEKNEQGLKKSTDGPVRNRDEVDARAPRNSNQEKSLRAARAALAAGQVNQAVRHLNSLIRGEELQYGSRIVEQNSVAMTKNGNWVPVWNEIHNLLQQLPAETLNTLRLAHNPQRELNDALQQSDVKKVADIANRYLFTEAGAEAADRLASIHFDRGEFGMAAYWYQRLVDINASTSEMPAWQNKAIIARALSGALSPSEIPGEIDVSLSKADRGSQTLTDWPMMLGTASRRGAVVAGEPLLLSRWRIPMTNRQSVEDHVDSVVDELTSLGRVLTPTVHAISVNGLLACRTMGGGVQVIDLTSGKRIWRSEMRVAPETLIKASRTQRRTTMTFINGRMVNQPTTAPADTDQVTNLLFRDAAWGTISSDREQLFMLEGHALNLGTRVSYYSRFARTNRDPYRRDWKTNRIASYDLKTGRPRWSVGGPDHDEPFDPPMAGTYFHGAPTPSGDELFVVGERSDRLYLMSLDRKTGKERWSTFIGSSDRQIDIDFERRMWPSHVAVGDSVVVCPTGVGWLVAVDRTSRSVLWAYRYSEPRTEPLKTPTPRFGYRPVLNYALNTRWSPMPPVIVGNRVLFTPSESAIEAQLSQSQLVCLNLFTGKQQWSLPKERYVYLAGIIGKRPVVVGVDSIAGIEMDSGKVGWSIPFSNSTGRPSGRGVEVNGKYLLPMASGVLWKIDVATGKITNKSYLPNDKSLLGNLLMIEGKLVSVSSKGIECFEQLEPLQQEIESRLAKNDGDVWARVRMAQIHLLDRRYEDALKQFNKVDPESFARLDYSPQSEMLRRAFNSHKFEALTARISKDLKKYDGDFKELEALATTEQERLVVAQLGVDRAIARGEFTSAFETLMELTKTEVDQLVRRSDDSRVKVRVDTWIQGRLKDVWSATEGQDRDYMDQNIAAMADKALQRTAVERRQLMKFVAFHPAAVEVAESRIQYFLTRREFAKAETEALRLGLRADRESKAKSLFHLAELYRLRLLASDAEPLYQQLKQEYGDLRYDDNKTMAQFVDSVLPADADETEGVPAWNSPLEFQRGVANYLSTTTSTITIGDSPLQYFRDYRLQYSSRHQRMDLIDNADDKSIWTVPLRIHARGMMGTSIQFVGHQMTVLHRGALHYLSPVDQSIVWTRELDTRGGSQGYYNSPTAQSTQSMQRMASMNVADAMYARSAQVGRVDAANSEFVCYRGRRTLTVADIDDGRIRWVRDSLPKVARIMATPELIYVIPSDQTPCVALRAADGKLLKVENLDQLCRHALHADGQSLTTLIRIPDSPDAKPEFDLRKTNVLTGKVTWTHRYPGQTQLSRLDDETLAVIGTDRTFQLINLQDGESSTIGTLDADLLKADPVAIAFRDQSRVYLVLNEKNATIRSYAVPALDLQGHLLAFDETAKKLAWKREAKGMQLLLQEMHAPILVLGRRTETQKNNSPVAKSHFVIINKSQGKTLADKEMLSAPYGNTGFRIQVDQKGQSVKIRNSNEQFMFSPAKDKPSQK